MSTQPHDDDRRLLLAGLAGAAGLAALARRSSAGPLEPPPGPVAPTSKPLGEVEPRTAVQSLSAGGGATYLISQPGSYYLTGNIDIADNTVAIAVQAAGVTIDLSGFTISAPSGSGNAIAVLADAGSDNVTVHNGRLSCTRMILRAKGLLQRLSFVGANPNAQVSASQPSGVAWTVRDCDFSGGSSTGACILVANNAQFTIQRCTFFGASSGIEATTNGHALIHECVFHAISTTGVRFTGTGGGVVANCTAFGCGTGFASSGVSAFYGNAACACFFAYSGVTNTTNAPATASAWANLIF